MNTTETNKKLAEFLGWKKPIFGNGLSRQYDYKLPSSIELYGENELHYCSDCGNDLHLLDGCYTENLKFHNDWNWLMLVIIKAKEGEAELNKEGDKLLYNIYEALTDVNIYTTYKACSMFVNWYNQNKLKNND